MRASTEVIEGLNVPRWRQWPSIDNDTSVGSPPLRGYEGDLSVLSKSTLLSVGTGAVGGTASQVAARHMVGTQILVDPDRYGEDSWRTQPALPTDAGQFKAWVQAQRAYDIHPHGTVRAAVGFAQDVPLAVYRQADVLLVAGDNREVLAWVGQVAAGLGKPLIQGAVHGESWTAFVRVFDQGDPEAPCPSCLINEAEYRLLGTRLGCDPARARLQGKEPTRTLPVICGMAGNLAASEALKRLLNVQAKPLAGEELAYCLLTHRLLRTELPRRRRCRGNHRRWRQVEVSESLAQVTLTTLAASVGMGVTPGLQVRSDLPWISFALCAVCGRKTEVRQFARLTQPVARCHCGAIVAAGPMGKRAVLPAGDLQACRDLPLPALGLGPGAAVGMSEAEDWTYFFAAGSPLSFEPEETGGKNHE